MVEFCTACGTSLPKGDLSFKAGKLFTSPDYVCPHCGKPANPNAPAAHIHNTTPPASNDKDLVIRKGQATLE